MLRFAKDSRLSTIEVVSKGNRGRRAVPSGWGVGVSGNE